MTLFSLHYAIMISDENPLTCGPSSVEDTVMIFLPISLYMPLPGCSSHIAATMVPAVLAKYLHLTISPLQWTGMDGKMNNCVSVLKSNPYAESAGS